MRRVLVTGAASGIGKAQAAAFRKAGDEVIAVDLKDGIDVSDPEQVKQLAEKVGTIDVLLNTAGVLDGYAGLSETDFETWTKVLNNNLNSIFLMSKAFLPEMKAKKSGVIINMASIAGLVAGGGGIAYTASKHAIVGFTKQLALDEAANGIQVLAIAPGAIDTPMNAADFTEDGGAMAKKVAEETPAKRWGTAEEVAELTLFLASPAANYMTGSVIPIDGGWTIK